MNALRSSVIVHEVARDGLILGGSKIPMIIQLLLSLLLLLLLLLLYKII
jgi:hypothetical protein